MKLKKTIALLGALPLLALAYPATAQTDLTCADIDFNYEVTSRFPDVAEHCVDVVEVDGERFAKFSVEIVRTGNNSATFRFVDPDNGQRGPVQSVDLEPDWRANINGRDYRIRELGPGQELNIYMPSDRWEAHVARNTTGYFAVYYPTAMEDDEGDDAGAAAMLPATAGSMPLFGLFGGLALFSAFMVRVFRRK